MVSTLSWCSRWRIVIYTCTYIVYYYCPVKRLKISKCHIVDSIFVTYHVQTCEHSYILNCLRVLFIPLLFNCSKCGFRLPIWHVNYKSGSSLITVGNVRVLSSIARYQITNKVIVYKYITCILIGYRNVTNSRLSTVCRYGRLISQLK